MNFNSRNSLIGVAAAALGTAWLASSLVRSKRTIDLQNKVVLITGGSRGLGLVLAREFAAENAKIAICARDSEELENAKRDLETRGANVLTMPCDVTNKADIKQFVDAVRAEFGRVDVLINNAGTIQVSPIEHLTEADYEESLRTHFWAPFYFISEVLPEMRDRKAGRIVNISSIGGKMPIPHMNAYVTGKFALSGFSEGLRTELIKDGIYVTTVCPGMIRTGSPRNAFFKGRNEEEYAWFKTGDSIPGLSTSAEDCARQIVTATKRGDAELIVTLPAVLAAAFHGVAPGISSEVNSIVNGFLPLPGGIGEARTQGKNSESRLSNNVFTQLTDEAAKDNNQMVN